MKFLGDQRRPRDRIEAALRAVLPESVEIDIGPGRSGRDDEVEARIQGKRLRVRWADNAWLSVVRPLVGSPRPPDVVVADRVPPASREELSDHGVGWVETTGAAEIVTESLLVSRTGRPRPSKKIDGWTPAALSVAEAVLTGMRPTVLGTHRATGLSVGACTRALRLLTNLGFLEAEAARGRDSGRRVADADALLDAYVAAAHDLQPPLRLEVGVTWRDPEEGVAELGRLWDAHNVSWVATGVVAASVVAPLLTSAGSAEVYIAGDSVAELELAASRARLRPIEGGRLTLAPCPTVATFRLATRVDDLQVAPWPRLVADLRRSGVRGEDAAEHLRKVVGRG